MSDVETGLNAEDRRRSRTILILIVLTAVAALVAVFTPEMNDSDTRLSSTSPAPMGGRIVHDLAGRFGWDVQRRRGVLRAPTDPRVIHAVLDPEDALEPAEIGFLLASVRGGGALLVAGEIDGLMDSLGYRIRAEGPLVGPGVDCRKESAAKDQLRMPTRSASVAWSRPTQSDPLVFARVEREERKDSTRVKREVPALAGVQFGAGRIVVTGAGILRNDIIRQCASGADAAFVSALQWLSDRDGAPPRRVLLFDEYHHGQGPHPGSLSAVWNYMTGTTSGHALLQAIVAGIILLIASAPRPIMPTDPERIPRRSPLEHADALAHAYTTVKATRTAVSRLVGGVRRRTVYSRTARDADDDAFLADVATAWPALAGDASVVREALRRTVKPRELASIATALYRIERTLVERRPPSSISTANPPVTT